MSENMNNTAPAEELQDINEYKKVRMDKLFELQQNGRDPYTITKFDVDSKNAALKSEYEKKEAEIKAAVHLPFRIRGK